MRGGEHPSSWSSSKQREHAALTGRHAWETSDPDLAACIDAAVEAIREAFSHLDRAEILQPPPYWYDAALARQAMVVILIEEFLVPKRIIAAVSLMSRDMVIRGPRQIEERRASATFDAMLTRAMARARALHSLAWRNA